MSVVTLNLLDRTLPFGEEGKGGAVQKKDEGAKSGTTFAAVLKESMENVNDLQHVADEKTRKLALGEVNDISEVVVAASEAEMSLRLFMEIRNKLVDAYQQIARMPV